MTQNIYLQHCRLGLAFAEDELRKCCQRDITYIQQELRKAFESNVCIRETEMDIRRMEGWDLSELKFQHSCHKKPACYEFLSRIVGKLSTASKVNLYILLKNISLQDFKDDDCKIAKLFLEPWMGRCCRLEDLNAYFLLEMLGNLKSVNENDVANAKEQSRIKTLQQEHIDKMRNIAEAVFHANIVEITKEDRYIFLQAVINVLSFEQGPETDKVIQKIQDFMDLEDSAMANITLQNLTGPFARTMHEAKDKDTRLRTQKEVWFHELNKKIREIPYEDSQAMLTDESDFLAELPHGALEDPQSRQRKGKRRYPVTSLTKFLNLEGSAMADITLPGPTATFARTMHEAEDKDTRLNTQKADSLHEMPKHGIHRLPEITKSLILPDVSSSSQTELMMLKPGTDILPGISKPRTFSDVPSSSQTKLVLQKEEDLEHHYVFSPQYGTITCIKCQDVFRDLLYYLEKNVGPDAKDTVQHICKLATGECNEIPTYHYKKIKKLLKRTKQHIKLERLLLNESESTNFKTYFLGLLIMESVLRPYIERKITLIHTDVTNEFTRHKLCDVADTDDICRADGIVSDEVSFKHDCKETPQCSKFLQCVLDKRSPTCKQKQYRMFKSVNPQTCLTNVWDFAKLFMDPWMHTNNGFEDLDVFCLLTLLENVQMFDANQSKVETLQQKVSKARYEAYIVLQMNTKKMKTYTMNVRLHDLIYILEEGILPVPYRAIQQLKDLLDNKAHLFDIRLDREAKRQHCGQSVKKAGHGCWYKNIIALRYLNPVFVDIVEGEINKLHETAVNTFGRKPCPSATFDDICTVEKNTAIFKHTCPKTLVACQKLLDIIKEHTEEGVSFRSMLKGTDPQLWLDSPFDYARIFLKKESRWKKAFEDCDVTALCGIVEQCKPLMNMFNKSMLKRIRNVRNQPMHAAEMEISQQELEDNIDEILEILRYIKLLKDTGDAAEAIDFIQQLQACDIRLLRRLYSDLIDGELPDTVMKYKHVKAKAETLRQNIRYMKRESERCCSLEERPDSPSPGCYDEETSAKEPFETLTLDDEESTQSSTSSNDEQSGRGKQTIDESTNRARGVKRVREKTESDEPVLKKQRKMAEEINNMSPEELRAVLLKTLKKDPDLMADVLEK